jgi:hypothetical protein
MMTGLVGLDPAPPLGYLPIITLSNGSYADIGIKVTGTGRSRHHRQ